MTRSADRISSRVKPPISLPDTSPPAFRAEARRQSLVVVQARNDDDEAFIASLCDWNDLAP